MSFILLNRRIFIVAAVATSILSCSSTVENFTVVVLPDTQFYVSSMHGGTPEMFEAQTQWIVENREPLNIAFVTQLGDLVQNGDSAPEEWLAANSAMSRLDDPEVTGLPDGIPYGIAVGNHDQLPEGDPNGSTSFYNQYFGMARFASRDYYGGHYGANNDSHYELFSASGLEFIVVHLEYDVDADIEVLKWADALLKEHASRRAIVVTHYLIGSGDPAEFSPQGRAIYRELGDNENLFLMLGGHIGSNGGEGRRVDTRTIEGRQSSVVSLLADYQSRENGGNGMLRILRFNPSQNEILVRTFSPVANDGRGAFEQDADSEFVIPYIMTNPS